jgi:hypothetical protein
MTDVGSIIEELKRVGLPEVFHRFIPELADILANILLHQPTSDIDKKFAPLFEILRDQEISVANGQITVHDVTGEGIAIGHGAQAVTLHFHLSPAEQPTHSLTRTEVLSAFSKASSLLRIYTNEIAGIHIDRGEVEQIIAWIHNSTPKAQLGMLLDQPGSGKTVIMRDVLVRLEEEHIPVLAIKSDHLTNIKTKDELDRQLDLPATIEECIHLLASEGPVVLLFDQIDALSLALSRDQATLDVILSLIARLRDHENLCIIAACRRFDLKNDPHLAKIKIDRTFELQPLNEEQITTVLQAVDLHIADLLPAHRALLSTVLHLDIYINLITDDDNYRSKGFRTLQDLYEALWRKLITNDFPERPTPHSRIDAIYHLVDHLQNRLQLTAPIAVLDGHAEAALYLEREGFIRQEKGNWLFTHQTLFDYCYARRFVAQGRSLHQEILHSPQGLFERSQILQILAYLRGADFETYRRELTRLVFHQDIRYHLRLVIIGWFASLPDPKADELFIALQMLHDENSQIAFLQAAGGNTSWFDILESQILPSYLQNHVEKTLDAFIRYLSTLIEQRTDRILAALIPYIGHSEAWHTRIAFCLSQIQQWQSCGALDALCKLVAQGHFSRFIGLSLHNLAQTDAAAGCRVLRAYLDRRLDELVQQKEQDQHKQKDDPNAAYKDTLPIHYARGQNIFGELGVSELAQSAAQSAPLEFVEQLLPWFIQASLSLNEHGFDETYPTDLLFTWGWYDQRTSDGASFATTMAEALTQLARTHPEAFRTIASQIVPVESFAVQRLLVIGYLADPAQYAQDIFIYLQADTRRLKIGELLESSYYDSSRLYGAVFPHLERTQQATLEQVILDFLPVYEQKNPPQRGLTQLRFLQHVDPHLLSNKAFRRLQELQRKFPQFRDLPPQGIRTGSVETPINEAAQSKMSDDTWLEAMRTYDDSTSWDAPQRDPFKGGVIELSRAFAEQVKKEPLRFYRLAQRFDEHISLHYVEKAISGLAESDAPLEWVCNLVRQFTPRIEGEYRKLICYSIGKRAEEGIPNDILDVMTDWALHDPDPAIPRGAPDTDSQYDRGGILLHHGINTVRGSALQAATIGALTHKPPQMERAIALLQAAAQDSSTAVRACVIECLNHLLPYTSDTTLAIFEQTVQGHPELLQSVCVYHLLYRLYRRYFSRIQPYIEAKIRSEDGPTRQAGARLLSLAAFEHREALALAEQIIQGDTWVRCGAAQVYAHNLGQHDIDEVCQKWLLKLMHDQDQEVLTYVGECFERLRPEHLYRVKGLIDAFLRSPALPYGARQLIAYLKPLAKDEQELALQATECLIDVFGQDIVDIRTSAALLEEDVTWLPLTVYTHANTDQLKSRAIHVFERLLQLGSVRAQQALTAWDRR